MKTKIIQNIKSIIIVLLLVVGVSYVSAYSTWTPPDCGPTGCNTDAPINVGTTAQAKNGPLAVGKSTNPTAGYALDVPNIAFLGGVVTQAFQMPTGAVNGYVLTSGENGTASWQESGGSCLTYDSGWFAHGNETSVTKTFTTDLGTDLLDIALYGASAADGGGTRVYIGFDSQGSENYGAMIQDVTSASLKFSTRNGFISWTTSDHDYLNSWVSARILARPMFCI